MDSRKASHFAILKPRAILLFVGLPVAVFIIYLRIASVIDDVTFGGACFLTSVVAYLTSFLIRRYERARKCT
jgi:hypothetical protein